MTFYRDMGKKPAKLELDRIKVDENYCKENCRWATEGVQAYNQRLYKNSSSGKSGVTYSKKQNRWIAKISKDGTEHHLGSFIKFEDAVERRQRAELEMYGYLKHGDYFVSIRLEEDMS